MPPKKKKLTVNPIVVGTVSTRSTRRQSIVNIEIPKLSRSKRGSKGIAKNVSSNQELITDSKEYAESEHSSVEYILESSSESERTDKSDRLDSSDTDALIKSESELRLDKEGEISPRQRILERISKSSRNKQGGDAGKTALPIKEVESIHCTEYAQSGHSSLEFIFESSSESERTDRSERIDSPDTDAFIESGSELKLDGVTLTQSQNSIDKEIQKTGKSDEIRKCFRSQGSKTVFSIEKVTDIQSKIRDDEEEPLSWESISDSSYKSESQRIDSAGPVTLIKSGLELKLEDVTRPSNSKSFKNKNKYFSKVFNSRLSSQTESPKDGEENNQALLQILQDWDDEEEESQDQEHSPERFVGEKHIGRSVGYENLEFGAEDLSEIIGKDLSITSTTAIDNIEETVISFTEEQVIVEEELKSIEVVEEDHSIKKEPVGNLDSPIDVVPDYVPCRESKNPQGCPVSGIESMDVAFEDDNIVDCVIEEIVPDTTEEMIITDSNIDNDPSSESHSVSEESRDTSNHTPLSVADKDSHLIENRGGLQVSEVVDITADVASEESHSLSTVDSNDAEVRRFFSKGIHYHESVYEENSSSNQGSRSPNFENTSMVEEQLIENEVAICQGNASIQEVLEGTTLEKETNSLELQTPVEMSENKNYVVEPQKQDIVSMLENDSLADQYVSTNIQRNDVEITKEKQLPEVLMTMDKDNVEIEVQMHSYILKNNDKKENDILSILEDDSDDDQNTTNIDTLAMKHVPVVHLSSKEPKVILEKDNEIYQVFCEKKDERIMEKQMKKMILGEAAVIHTSSRNESITTTNEDGVLELNLIEKVVQPTIDDKETVAISIENKIAEMHLDEVSVEESIGEEVAQLNLQDQLIVSEAFKTDTSKYSTEEIVRKKSSSEDNREKLRTNTENQSSGKGSRTNIQKPQKQSFEKEIMSSSFENSPKHTCSTKVKENKSREKKILEKSIKYPSPAPKKNKTEKKEKYKYEKKEKKVGKVDNRSDNDTDESEVRRSSRIKLITESNSSKKKTGRGLVKSKSESSLNSCDLDLSDNSSVMTESGRSTPVAPLKVTIAERKSRWAKSADNMSADSQNLSIMGPAENELAKIEIDDKPKMLAKDPVVEGRLKQFVHLKENSYKTDRMTCKEAKKMTCDCFLTAEEIDRNEYGCGEDCLNRLLMIECGNLCQVGDRCTNKRFQKTQFAPVEVFNTDKKGLGLRAAANIPFGEFILEYVGEVLNSDEFDKRAEVYSQDKNIHYYFMALRADAIIDATMKGNISRFINHSCDPNAETQKWTVNGELRIGFFSTRTILAGEEVTFDYRFQRYGKEAQKCFCGASICRGWLGEEPDSDEDEEEEEEETLGSVEGSSSAIPSAIKDKVASDIKVESSVTEFQKSEDLHETSLDGKDQISGESLADISPIGVPVAKKKVLKKKPRVELFEEIDQLNEEIEMLVTTGLKNQAHTLKLSRLVVRAKDPQQRAKLLRVLRRGELPCRRLFLDYHGLRLIHGYMIDAQQLVLSNKKYESMRLEMLQTLAVLPIPNKSMLQDSKVLSTVELWASDKDLTSPLDSDSNSPKTEHDSSITEHVKLKEENIQSEDFKTVRDQEEEIKFLANKLLEEWSNLKEVFKIPKKERIQQMKEHEREANKKFIQAQNAYENEQDKEKKSDRYRSLSVRYKIEKDSNRKGFKQGDKPSAEFLKLSKVERRKLFALQHELREEERRMKQREMWRQHEMNCMMMGTDPRFTAPFDPSRGFHCVWNPQIGQWQNYPSQTPSISNMSLPSHQIPKSMPNYSYTPPLAMNTNVGLGMPQMTHGSMAGGLQIPSSTVLPQMAGTLPPTAMPLVQYHEPIKEEDPSQVKFMGPIPPPVKLPPKWKCAKDKYGRPYYYHIRLRKSQWEPPPLVDPIIDESSESESSSDTSSISSDSSSDHSESDVDDTQLLLEVRKQMDDSSEDASKTLVSAQPKLEESALVTPSPEDKNSEEDMDLDESFTKSVQLNEDSTQRPSIDMRLKQLDLFKDDKPPSKKRRVGLCEEIIISPRTEEDKKQFKEDVKRYKANKEKLKRQKELILQQTKKQLREIELKKIKEKRSRTSLKAKIKDMPDFNSDAAKKIKETFRANMASTVVNSLNAYRKADCMEGKITNTEDFKHLARKLTHFVMLKEMKHISKIEELTCTESVKMKAREYIRKYMSKFGEVYVKRNDSPDFKD